MKSQQAETTLLIRTNQGDIRIKLYDETPLHRDNFLNLANEGFFQERIFHRVIKDFMIQGGESLVQDSTRSESNDTIQAEIKFPFYYHKRGALAAARLGDEMNPKKASSADQFYIVTGEKYSEGKLVELDKSRFARLKQHLFSKLQLENNGAIKAFYKEGNKEAIAELRENMRIQTEEEAAKIKDSILYTAEQKEVYKTLGGTPFLDNEYTVFGEVIEGMDVVDKIQNLETNRNDKPKELVVFEVIVEK